jgi:8-oxo-dGTP diphosphatase
MEVRNIHLAGGIILDRQGRILLLHRNTTKKQHWEIPGGKIEPGEIAEQAVIRELREELGIEVNLIKTLGVKEFNEDDYTINFSWYLAEITDGDPQVSEAELFDDLQFFSQVEIRKDYNKMSLGTQNFLAMLDEGLIL